MLILAFSIKCLLQIPKHRPIWLGKNWDGLFFLPYTVLFEFTRRISVILFPVIKYLASCLSKQDSPSGNMKRAYSSEGGFRHQTVYKLQRMILHRQN